MASKSGEKNKRRKRNRVYTLKPVDLLQNRVIKTRVTEEEEKKIREEAEKNGMSMAAYIRSKLLNNDGRERDKWARLAITIREIIFIKKKLLKDGIVNEEVILKVFQDTLNAVELMREAKK